MDNRTEQVLNGKLAPPLSSLFDRMRSDALIIAEWFIRAAEIVHTSRSTAPGAEPKPGEMPNQWVRLWLLWPQRLPAGAQRDP